MPHTNQLRFHRKKWALTQNQVAELIGLSARSTVSDHEFGTYSPGLRAALGYQVIFGAPIDVLLEGLAQEIEDAVIARGAALDRRLDRRTDAVARRQREFLQHMISRAGNRREI